MHGLMVTLVYSVPTFSDCGYRLMSPATQLVLLGGDVTVLGVMMLVRPRYRKMILAGLPCFRASNPGEQATN